jgi:hypothetical protein
MKTYNFELFWWKFHEINRQLKNSGITQARKIWNNCNCSGRHKKIIQGIEKTTKLSAIDYLRTCISK